MKRFNKQNCTSSVAQAMHTKPTIKVYYPKHVEKSFHDYDETGKYMYAAKVDDTFWFFKSVLVECLLLSVELTHHLEWT